MKLKENNFFFLLAGLLITLLLAPIAPPGFRQALKFAFLGTMLVGVWSLHESRLLYIFGWALAAVMIVLAILENVASVPSLFIADLAILFLFCLMTTAHALRQVLFADEVNANRFAGAVCIYMLMGLIWASIYAFLHLLDPGAFTGLPPAGEDATPFLDLLYYSYVTLTTLGFGDITPATRIANAFTYLEAISGVMYVAILVASLVGTHVSNGRSKDAGTA